MQLTRGLAGHLDRLEESHTELRKDIAMGTKGNTVSEYCFASPDENPNLIESALEKVPRMHLDSSTCDPESNVEKRVRQDVPPQFNGEHEPGYGVYDFGRQRFYVAADGGVEDFIGVKGNGGAGMDMPGPDLHGMKAAFRYRYPDARQKELVMKPLDGKELYQGLGSGFLEWGRGFERQIVLAR